MRTIVSNLARGSQGGPLTLRQKAKGGALLAVAFVTCPCHIPIFLALLGGTAFGAFLTKNLTIVAGALVLSFVGSLVLANSALQPAKRQSEAADCCAPTSTKSEAPK